jgi:hypothetical protein
MRLLAYDRDRAASKYRRVIEAERDQLAEQIAQ